LVTDLIEDLTPDLIEDLINDLTTDLIPVLIPDLTPDLTTDLTPDLVANLVYFFLYFFHLCYCQIKRGGPVLPFSSYSEFALVGKVLPLIVHVKWYAGRAVEFCSFKWRFKIGKCVDQVDGTGRRAGVL
jgi:hypothetical protein